MTIHIILFSDLNSIWFDWIQLNSIVSNKNNDINYA